MDLVLSDEERALLAELLEQDFRNLKEEIGSTDTAAFRDELRAREQMLIGILEKLNAAPPGSGRLRDTR